MPFKYRVALQSDHLLVTLTGDFDITSAMEATAGGLTECWRYRASEVVVDFRSLKGSITTAERYDYASFVSGMMLDHAAKFGRPLRVAFVGSPNLVDPNKFGETVAVNRGAIVKVTTDMDEGLAWLRKRGEPRES
jgi:hypothetical protein